MKNPLAQLLVVIALTIVIACIALIPEATMYFVYNTIAPECGMQRVFVLTMFWLFGSGVCIGFAGLGVILWMAMITAVLG